MGCLFILFMVSFALQKLLSLLGTICSFLFFVFLYPDRYCCNVYQKCSAYVSYRSFIVSGVTFRTLIHFEFIFVCGIRECSNFILLHVAVQLSQYHLLKSVFSPLYILASLL